MNRQKLLRLAVPLIFGLVLIWAGGFLEENRTKTYADGVVLYNEALAALEEKDLDKAHELFLRVVFYAKDPELRAASLHNAATIGWIGELSDYETLVETYKEALRNKPGFEQASFNLELLYYLREKKQPPDDEEGKKVPGRRKYVPGRGI